MQKKRKVAPRKSVIAQLMSVEGAAATTGQLDLPVDFDQEQLGVLLNELLGNEDPLPYSFFVQDTEITGSILDFMEEHQMSGEELMKIVYKPEAVFRVRPVQRCSASMPGHTEPILCLAFSPDGAALATGSGDRTIRLWDLNTQTPIKTCVAHKQWVLSVAWSPDALLLASGSMDGAVCIWDAEGNLKRTLKGHRKWVNAIAWQPLHLSDGTGARKLISASKDGTCKIWDAQTGRMLLSMGGHSAAVTCVRWGGHGLIYTASQDRIILVRNDQGHLVRKLKGHAHWINTMALSTDFLLRTGPFDHTDPFFELKDHDARLKAAQKRWADVMGDSRFERLVTGSDDFTMFLWDPVNANKPIARMTGHQQLVNSVAFSPDGQHIASGSFDKSIRVWSAESGKFVTTLRGHVGAVYQVCWSSDSRMILSASKDTTSKVWSLRTRDMMEELVGHHDEVYAVEWAPNGGFAASAGKDKQVRLWRGAN